MSEANQPLETPKKLTPVYHVASVERSEMPHEDAEGNWYRYVLEGGRNPITGYRRGTLREVKTYAQQCADELNERNSGNRSVWSVSQKKK